jgi:L-malate glycosyltransferase
LSIRILHLIKSLGRGGAETLLPETLKLHSRDEFEFHYGYFLPWKDQMVKDLASQGAKVVCFNASNNIELLLKTGKLVRYIKENKIDLIHAHLPWAGVAARLAGKVSGVPVLYTEHNKQERYHWATRFMNLTTMNWQTCVVAVSKDVEESIRKHKKIESKLVTIPNGVNVDHYSKSVSRGEVRTALNIPEHAPVIGTVAVFRSQKRLDVWLDNARAIQTRFPDAHFILVGDGPLKNDLIRKRSELKMERTVHMPGLQTDVRPFLAAFDVYMITSVFEGLPLALLEAMATGVPVISTDAGGIKEVIRHSEDGLLAPVDQPGLLVDFASRVLLDESLRAALATSGRSRIVEHFSMKQMVRSLEVLYDQTLNGTA